MVYAQLKVFVHHDLPKLRPYPYLISSSSPVPHHSTQAVWVPGERYARHTELHFNTF